MLADGHSEISCRVSLKPLFRLEIDFDNYARIAQRANYATGWPTINPGWTLKTSMRSNASKRHAFTLIVDSPKSKFFTSARSLREYVTKLAREYHRNIVVDDARQITEFSMTTTSPTGPSQIRPCRKHGIHPRSLMIGMLGLAAALRSRHNHCGVAIAEPDR